MHDDTNTSTEPRRLNMAAVPVPLSRSFSMAGGAINVTAATNTVSISEGSSSTRPNRAPSVSLKRGNSIVGQLHRRPSHLTDGSRGRRRMTNINPNLTIDEITRTTRTSTEDRRKYANIDRKQVFKFTCEGEIETETRLKGSKIRWQATFDKPIEELIYPSLQRFDNIAYEEKKRLQERLHGHRSSSATKQSFTAPAHFHVSSQQDDGIKIDMLPDSEVSEETGLMFLYTPKWVMTLDNGGVLTRPSTAQSALSENQFSSPADEKFSRHLHHHHHHHTQHHSLHFDDHEEKGHEVRVSSPYDPKPMLYPTLIDEIEIEGEKQLRQQVLTRHEQRQLQEERELIEKQESSHILHVTLPGHHRPYSSSHSSKNNKLPPLVEGDAEYLYASLRAREKQQLSGDLHKVTKLTEQSAEEIAYETQSRIIKDVTPAENAHLMDGLLFYRMRAQLNSDKMKQEAEVERKKMSVLAQQRLMMAGQQDGPRRYSNTFSRRLSARRMSSSSSLLASSSATEMHALRGEDANVVTAEHIKTLPEASEVHLQRLRRAVQSRSNHLDTLVDANVPTDTRYDQVRSKSMSIRRSLEYQPQSLEAASGGLDLMTETRRRLAQDQLLFAQLEAGLLPESFLKQSHKDQHPNPHQRNNHSHHGMTINLSRYGIGDQRGLCLAKCLGNLEHSLEAIGLSDNRLTSISLPAIIASLQPSTLLDLDLSFNNLHDHGMKALALHFAKVTATAQHAMRFLDLCNCHLTDKDLALLCGNLKVYSNHLEELLLAGNIITGNGAAELCQYLSSRTCKLVVLDVSWNSVSEAGGIEFSNAMTVNKSLTRLNIASNGLGDHAGQRLIDSLKFHPAIEEVVLAQNGLKDCTAFVVAQVVKGHPSLRKLDLSLNPLGEAGARAIFRQILRGLSCFVTMRNCSYTEDNAIFNQSYPSDANPYTLDLTEPYHRAVVQELMLKMAEDPMHCSFGDLQYREQPPKGPETTLQLVAIPITARTRDSNNSKIKALVGLKGMNTAWDVPKVGTLRFSFHQLVFIPSMEQRIDDKALDILQLIIENGLTEQDKRQWLKLLCQDLYFTTKQAQGIIDRFKRNKTIGAGGLSVLDIMTSLWKYLLDNENCFDFLYGNMDSTQRRDLVYGMLLLTHLLFLLMLTDILLV